MTEVNAQNAASIKYLCEQLITARKEIANLRQQIKALGHVHQKDYATLQRTLADWKCTDCRAKAVEPEAATDAIDTISEDLICKSIGTVYTHFPEKRATPRQPAICSDLIAKLELNNDILTNPDHALQGLNDFSHMWLLFHFHKNDSTHVRAKVAPPRLNGARTGVFASRSPHRPSPIGLSLVKIERVDGSSVYFSGVDMIDGTPVLDIKPYIPLYDCPVSQAPAVSSPGPSTSRRLDGRETSHDALSEYDSSSLDLSLSIRLDGGGEAGSGGATIRPDSRIGEREAPDGEEGEYPASTSQSPPPTREPPNPSDVRVPSWINESRVSQLNVLFSERAIVQLRTIKGPLWQQIQTAITNVLREDPRSVYLRTRWGNQFYTFRISEVHVSCKFDDNAHTVTVLHVRDVESLDDN